MHTRQNEQTTRSVKTLSISVISALALSIILPDIAKNKEEQILAKISSIETKGELSVVNYTGMTNNQACEKFATEHIDLVVLDCQYTKNEEVVIRHVKRFAHPLSK